MKFKELPVFIHPNAVLILSHENLVIDMMIESQKILSNPVSKRFLDCEVKKFNTAYVAEGIIWVFVELEGRPEMQDVEKIMRRKSKRIKRAGDRLRWMKKELINNPEFVNLPIYESILAQINTIQDYLVNDDAKENAFNKDDFAEGRL